MCGICGIVDFSSPVDPGTIRDLSNALVHRGPNESGIDVHGEIGLGVRRLSIIDADGSSQPLFNEDRSIRVVFNGEIYNYKSLRHALIGRGHRFRTEGDGEVIAHLYEEHGESFVDKLNGMFAIALWDAGRRRLVLVRDRLGIKPLYCMIGRDRLIFASESKAFLAVPSLELTLNPDAMVGVMYCSAVPGPNTCFKEVVHLPPGYLATFDLSGYRQRAYWDVAFGNKRPWKEDELDQAVEELIEDAVRLRMISDVPLGLFLSGGVDSSLVGAMMTRLGKQPVQAYSIGYKAEFAYLDELEHATAVARHHAMDHNKIIVEWSEILAEFEKVTWFLDEPCGDPSAFLTLAIARHAAREVTVVLSGVGGDEVFGGYRRHLAARIQRGYLRLPELVRSGMILPLLSRLPEGRSSKLRNSVRIAKRFVASANLDAKVAWAHGASPLYGYDGPIFADPGLDKRREEIAVAELDRHWKSVAELADPVDQVMYVDLKTYLVDARLRLQDRMSMAVSLEARVPLLDHRLIELAASVPSKMKIRGTRLKAILKRIAHKHLPIRTVEREKKGFAMPLDRWLREPLRERVFDGLTPQRVSRRGLFDVSFVERIKKEHYKNGRDFSLELFQLLLIETWYTLFVDGSPSERRAKSIASSH